MDARASVDEVECALVGIWAEVLKRSPATIGKDDHFFALGGNSLLMIEVMDRVVTRFFPEAPDEGPRVSQFFSHGTIRSLAAYLVGGLPEPPADRTSDADGATRAIAIIGMSCRLPGAVDVETFWRNLCAGLESIASFTDAELLRAGVDPAEIVHPRYVKRGAVLEGLRLFDAEYFGLTPREAANTSPEQRLLIECAEEARQDAGHGTLSGDERIGVFVGTGLSTYLLDHIAPSSQRLESTQGLGWLVGNTSAATRISYLLNLTGPSITVDTACSSSLVAVHLACKAILSGECSMALAGGATVRRYGPRGYYAEEDGIFSPDGHCRPFDRRAQGTVISSGAAVVLLKQLSAAVTDGDTIRAVILGTGLSNDGGEKLGYTAPSAAGQAAAIRRALADARVEPSDIQYLETHGTATAIGDLLELEALGEVFAKRALGTEPCTLGTLKANVGHLEAAAGVAGLLKVALALQARRMPPAINFREADPRFGTASSAFALNTELKEWPRLSTPRRAGISSFGIGGTNAHAVLEEAPVIVCPRGQRTSQLLLISARSEAALRESCQRLSSHLRRNPDADLAEVAYTLQVGRKSFAYRRHVVAVTAVDAANSLARCVARPSVASPLRQGRRPVVFLFPGQGAQNSGMLMGLYQDEAVFRGCFDECARFLRPVLGRDLLELLEGPTATLSETSWCQPALFVVEYSLARLWQSWGVTPSLMIGHSLGEYVAACIAGLFDLETALALVATRARLMQTTETGAMLAMRCSRDEAAALLEAGCSIAAVNGMDRCVIAGPRDSVERIKEQLNQARIPNVELNVSHAFHSAHMDAILPEFAMALRRVKWGRLKVPYISSRTGIYADPNVVARAAYWLDHLRNTVEFAACVQTALREESAIFIEIGPGTTLGSFVRSMPGSQSQSIIASVGFAIGRETLPALQDAVGRAWQLGVSVDWNMFNAGRKLRRVPLPTYPFERAEHWLQEVRPKRVTDRGTGDERLPFADWFNVPIWTQRPRMPRGNLRCTGRNGPVVSNTTCCILFAGWPELENALAARLAIEGVRLIVARISNRFSWDDKVCSLDTHDPNAFTTLSAALDASGLSVNSIVHCGEAGLTQADEEVPDSARLSRGIYSVLDLCKAFCAERTAPMSLTIVTRAAQEITGGDGCNACGAMLTAVSGVISAEFPNIRCRSIDLDPEDGRGLAVFDPVEDLVDEITAPSGDELIALRKAMRWVRSYQRIGVPELTQQCSLLRSGGVYVVVGGLGGIGWTLAEYIGRKYRAKLVLTGRSQFPERSRWREILEVSNFDDSICKRIRAIQSLESEGAEFAIVQADVAKIEDVQRLVETVCKRFGRIDGLVHSAGVTEAGAIYLKTRESAERVIAAKVLGTWALYAAVAPLEPAFFLCCSSLAGVIGPSGQFDYAAANAFQDAFCKAHSRSSRTRLISVNWDAWQSVGMSAKTPAPVGMRHTGLQDLAFAISCLEGTRVFEAVLANPLPQWIISTRPLRRRDRRQEELSRAGDSRALPVPVSEKNSEESRTSLESTIATIWQDLLGVAAINAEDDFFALGGDSLVLLELRARLESKCSRVPTLKELLACSTLAGMTNLLRET